MPLFRPPVKVEIFGLDGTTTTIYEPRLIPHQLEFPVSPETGKFTFSYMANTQFADRDVTGVFNPGVEQDMANFSTINAFCDNIRTAWMKVYVSLVDCTDPTMTETLADFNRVDGYVDPTQATWGLVWMGKIIDVSYLTGQLSGKIDISAVDICGWLDSIKFIALPSIVDRVASVGLIFNKDIPSFNQLSRGKLCGNMWDKDPVSIDLDTTINPKITLKNKAFAPNDFHDSTYLNSVKQWAKGDIFKLITDYVYNLNKDLFDTLKIKFDDLLDETKYAHKESITVNSQTSLWGIITELFNRKNSLIIFPTYSVDGEDTKIKFVVQSLESEKIGYYEANTRNFNFDRDNEGDFFKSIQSAPNLLWFNPYKGKKLIVQTGPVSVITTLNLKKNCWQAWDDTQATANFSKIVMQNEYAHVGRAFTLLADTNYQDPATYLYTTSPPTDGWEQDGGTLTLQLDVTNKRIKNVVSDDPGMRSPTAQTAALNCDVDSTFKYDSEQRLEVIRSKLIKNNTLDTTLNGTSLSHDPMHRTWTGGLGFNFTIHMDDGYGYKEFLTLDKRAPYFFTAKIDGLPALYIEDYPDDYKQLKEYDAIVIKIDKHILVYDMNAVIGLSANKPVVLKDNVTGAPAGQRFVWSSIFDDDRPVSAGSTYWSIDDLINELQGQVAFYRKSRVKTTLTANGIHFLPDRLGGYVTSLDVPDNSIGIDGATYGITPSWDKLTPESVVTKIVWNFDTMSTQVFTDFRNYI